ncbi:hypothetical protein ACLTEW_24400 [Gordonia lacunae]|uniref:hypothetical protein n=1 Tax=Gordonia TaxID=2053 RepID=UPI00200AAB12|nr:hypothetical protein [Gordonia terrae]UPW12009.1 hypothetical protein M1C59_25495 [Gordonia terrae]
MTIHTTPPRVAARPRWAVIALASVSVALAATWLTGPAHAAAATTLLAEGGAGDLMNGVRPDFSIFGPTVGSTWRRLLGGFWAACLAMCIIWIIWAGAKWSSANRRGFAGQQADAKAAFLDACVGFAACAGAAIIVGGIVFALEV